jgi:formate-dependent nitrite reductase membrane component NrfD
MVAVSMGTEGIGAALFLLSSWLDATTGMIAGLALVALGVLALFLHLGHPLKFWRVMAKSKSAWISQGAASTGVFMVVGVLSLVVTGHRSFSIGFEALAFVGAIAILLYSGLILSSMQAVPFWNNAIIPVAFFFQSFASASLLCVLILLFDAERASSRLALVPVAAGLILFVSLLMVVFLKSAPRAGAGGESLAFLTTGSMRRRFIWIVLFVGLMLPFMALIVYSSTVSSVKNLALGVAMAGALLRVVGDVVFRYSIIRSGIYEPLIQ